MRKLIINDNLRRSQALRIFYGHAISRILIWSFFLKLIFLHSKFPDINVLAFQISDFEYTTNYSTKHMKL